jgi:hypothetical protein
MKTCQDFAALLSLFAHNELEAESREAVVSHLVICAACRQKVEDYHELKKYLSKLPTPELPENLFADFHQGVLEKITRGDETQRQRLGLIAVLYALYRRQRFVIAVATLVLLMALPTWLMHERNSRSAPRSSLTQLLEKRDWTELYYAMLDGDLRTRLLNEPVPVTLLHTALNELLHAQRENLRFRTGLQQVLSKIKTPEGNSFSLSRSVRILGKVSATGFEPARRSARMVWNPEITLRALTRVEASQTLTMRELFLQTNLEGNKL